MINRKMYMNKLLSYKDTEFIKIITGIRRCGKSSLLDFKDEGIPRGSLLKLFMEFLLTDDNLSNVIYMNFESFEFDGIVTYKDMYNKIKEKISNNKKITYYLTVCKGLKNGNDVLMH